MVITNKILADILIRYINRKIDLSFLVGWAEDMLRESDFDNNNFEMIRDILACIGLGDVYEFGLTWDDCYNYLHKLGYDVKVEIVEVTVGRNVGLHLQT